MRVPKKLVVGAFIIIMVFVGLTVIGLVFYDMDGDSGEPIYHDSIPIELEETDGKENAGTQPLEEDVQGNLDSVGNN